MAKNVDHLQHVKSSVVNEGKPKLPQANRLVEGELAINYAEGVETISIKNSSGDIVTFSSDNYYTEQKLGSGFTGENSANTVTSVIESNERVISSALNDLEENKLDVSAYTPSVELWVSGTGENSIVQKGTNCVATGAGAIAEGSGTTATGDYSVAEGYETSAMTNYSHAEGYSTIASGYVSHAEGQFTTANGYTSHAEGNYTKASGYTSHAEGYNTIASGDYSHAEGYDTTASGDYSHAEGYETTASGDYSHAEGYYTKANGNYSHVEGEDTTASGSMSHAEGHYTKANGESSHAEGNYTSAMTYSSHAEGNNTKAIGETSHAEGNGTLASGNYSHAEGNSTIASGNSSHAEGRYTVASGNYSHVEGYNAKANGESSHAEGHNTTASGQSSHAEGYSTSAMTNYSHAEGYNTKASGDSSHAEGFYTLASGNYSHVEGFYTEAKNMSEHASGKYNVSSSASTTFGDSGNTLFSVGNGTADARHNAFEIRQNGDIYIVNKNGQDVRLQDEIGNITVDQVLDDSVSASTNPIASKAVYSALTDTEFVWANAYGALSGLVSSHTINTTIHITASDRDKLDSITGSIGTMAYENASSYSSATEVNTALGNKADASDLSTLSGTVTAHTADTNIHITSAERTAWNAKLDASDIADFFDDAKYEDSGTSKVINFYHGNTIKATINADDFIKDGMISGVTLESKSGTTYLVIDWNTDAGIQTTELNIGDIFEADNYYNKTEIDNKLGSGFTVSSITEVIEDDERIISASLIDLDTRKLDASAYTPIEVDQVIDSGTSASTDAVSTSAVYGFVTENFYTKEETDDGDEVISASLNDLNTRKLDESAFTEHASNTSIHLLQIVSAVTVSSDMSNVTCPDSITGASNNGAQALVIYENSGSTTDYTITVSSSYKSPDGSQVTMTCPRNGYCEVSYVNINGTIYVRGI